MRDPEARLTFSDDKVWRRLRRPLDRHHFLYSDLARQWQDRGDLVNFEIVDDNVLAARRIPFVSFPTEWCDLMLYQAGELTLRLQREAIEANYDLKDASAWNIIFEGGRPVFCDLLSFVPLVQKRWHAAGQFARHFILPLLISQKRGLPAHKAFHAWRDGMPHDVARQMLGAERFLTRYWPLMTEANIHSSTDVALVSEAKASIDDIRQFRTGVQVALGWMLSGVNPKSRTSNISTTWGNYINERDHYTGDDLDMKREKISHWLKDLKPKNVLDLGCNSGEFSCLAADAGADVLALDGDHEAIMRGAASQSSRIHFLVASLDDLRGGFGWNGTEFPGLPTRLHGHSDMTLMLALIHHLALGTSVPLDIVADFAATCTRRWLIVELISPHDAQIKVLKRQRNRDDPFPSLDIQEAIFVAAGFKCRERLILSADTRMLLLMEKATS